MPTSLTPAPAGLAVTRRNLHWVGEHVVAAARVAATGSEIALTPRAGGFGTPVLPDGGEVRVDGAHLVVSGGDGVERRERLRDRRAAVALVGLPVDGVPDEPLAVDEGAARFLARFWAFAATVLDQLLADASSDLEPAPVRLWPEHFDVAIELGSEAAGQRGAYGGSPGDDDHDEPYLYVAPWTAPEPRPLWNATAFRGAELSLRELLEAPDQRATALGFFRERLAALTGASR